MEVVLIIEDEVDIRESLVALLESRGYPAIGVADGAEAIHQLESGLEPCLIILDLMLPVMSGWEFRARQLQLARWANIPVVVLSGAVDVKDEAERLGAVAFLPKPLDFPLFYETVARYC